MTEDTPLRRTRSSTPKNQRLPPQVHKKFREEGEREGEEPLFKAVPPPRTCNIMNERILALDVGDARIGIAVSDPTRLLAQPVEVLHRKGWGPDCRRIKELCDQYETTEVLSGLPLNMDGTAGGQTQKVREFCAQLEKLGLTVYYQDERLTTVTAERTLIDGNMHRQERKQVVDKVAAVVILQSWLDAQAARLPEETEEPAMSENQDSNIIELVDDNGETVQFEHLATLEHEGEYYIALMVLDEDHHEEDDEGEVVIMKIAKDDEGEECYEYVEDENLQEVIFEKFLQLMEEQDGFVDAEDED